jgi:hypothetical protein
MLRYEEGLIGPSRKPATSSGREYAGEREGAPPSCEHQPGEQWQQEQLRRNHRPGEQRHRKRAVAQPPEEERAGEQQRAQRAEL